MTLERRVPPYETTHRSLSLGAESLKMFEAAQQAIEETRELLNEVAQMTGPGRKNVE